MSDADVPNSATSGTITVPVTGLAQPRTAAIHPSDRQYLTEFLRNRAAIEIGQDRDTLLVTRLESVVAEFGLTDIAALVRAMRIGNEGLAEAVVDQMTTNETSWFRDGDVFGDLMSHVLPRILERKHPEEMVTIWSAASSSGQEIYSLAMALDQRFPELTGADPRVRLLATDLSQTMVERVRAGTYSEIEVRRGLPVALRDRYFERQGSNWVVKPRLRRLVLARDLNLNGPLTVVPRCDLVLMRNVLIYFSEDVKSSILRRVRRDVLRPNGALVLGATELLLNADSEFDAVGLPNGVCYVPKPSNTGAKPAETRLSERP